MTLLHKVDIIQVDIIQNSNSNCNYSSQSVVYNFLIDNKEIILIQVFVIEKKQILNISQNINPKLPIKTGIWKNTERMNEIQ